MKLIRTPILIGSEDRIRQLEERVEKMNVEILALKKSINDMAKIVAQYVPSDVRWEV